MWYQIWNSHREGDDISVWRAGVMLLNVYVFIMTSFYMLEYYITVTAAVDTALFVHDT
jgi:hypothetical protein